jgi:hypothetical protein
MDKHTIWQENESYMKKFSAAALMAMIVICGGCATTQQTVGANENTQPDKAVFQLNRTTVSTVSPDKWSENDYGLKIVLTSSGYSQISNARRTMAIMINDKEITKFPPGMPIDRQGFLWHPGVLQVLPKPLTNPLTLEHALSLCREIMEK